MNGFDHLFKNNMNMPQKDSRKYNSSLLSVSFTALNKIHNYTIILSI